ncbi:hypothetical protein RHGRI_020746 [Rhododendron griersonianum]|uniref:Uncharacterized protein n=1 Tax=Rhododendron griersonianum TaxID=479676 RepID=A0AAV6JLU1_9ERIC|nr:hypothetical protein RHGRI_020746 [Rhododendron griersonianum]
MGNKDWQKTGSRSLRLGRSYAEAERESHFWLDLWRKIKREKGKKRKSKKSNSNSPVSLYDHDTYLQNFEEESRQMEPDILCRSFSARFADPSRTFSRNVFVE